MDNRYEIRAKAYMKPIRQWALANGIAFFTWADQKKAMARYEIFVCLKN